MKRTATLIACALAALLGAGCGGKVSARAQPTTVTKWKYHTDVGVPKGIIVEQHGDKITARLCDLKHGGGFVVESTLSDGTYFPERKVIVFPMGMPASVSLDHWLHGGGSHLSVPFDLKAVKLAGSLASHGSQQHFHFAAHRE